MIGINRQQYYRSIKASLDRKKQVALVLSLVESVRTRLPRLGGRKLYHILYSALEKIKVGRDKLFDILRSNRLLIKPKKRYHVTTNSFHRFKKHKNKIENLRIIRPEQVVVSDITYLGNRTKPMYLALVTDAYSKKILGYDVSDSLNTIGALNALKMAIKNRRYKTEKLIHHSDRGIQYCSKAYTQLLNQKSIQISMAGKGNCYENAMAERINGILKDEFFLDQNFKKKSFAIKSTKQAIELYNNVRTHMAIGYITPNQKHYAA